MSLPVGGATRSGRAFRRPVADRKPSGTRSRGVVSAYRVAARSGVVVDDDADDPALLREAVWVDLHDPDPTQRRSVGAALGIVIPHPDAFPSTDGRQVHRRNGPLVVGVRVLGRVDGDKVRLLPVTFMLCEDRLITVRGGDPRPFRTFAEELARDPAQLASAETALLGLLGAIVGRAGQLLQTVADELETLSGSVFAEGGSTPVRGDSRALRRAVNKIGHGGYLATRVRESLHGLRRAIPHLRAAAAITDAAGRFDDDLRALEDDVATLLDHDGHVMANATFLLDATLGLIDIQQSGIIKIFSVAAVILMPPTLVASVYGMNFRHMPELGWTLGYPYALALMGASAVLPYLYFRRRGWL